ncbi:MAG TPA: CCA tRNA nucleotidyltransferase [Virgibacillus sp.]|nr:CCA tRNA nucleotidyltransferase [Virgibacillus sp.]
MLTRPFQDGIKILQTIEQTGHQAYFVGGSVRDLLLDRKIGDIDIATSASPQLIQKIFPKVIPVGIEHGTVIVRHEHTSFEVTTFRLDGEYTDQRHPDSVQFINDIDRDLQRRDFTINALAMDKHGAIIDLFDGKGDLKRKIIRTVGDGYTRFTEDPLRILRAARFSSELGFQIATDTTYQMHEVKEQIRTVSVERMTVEVEKLFGGTFVNTGIAYLKETGIYKELPVMVDYPYIMERIPRLAMPLQSFAEIIALFCWIERDVTVSTWIKTWKCSNKTKQAALKLTQALDYYQRKGLDPWLIYELTPAYQGAFSRLINTLYPSEQVLLKTMTTMNDELPIQSKHDLAINGNDIIDLFPQFKKGPWIHDTLARLEKEVVFNRLNNLKIELKEWIICNPPVIN